MNVLLFNWFVYLNRCLYKYSGEDCGLCFGNAIKLFFLDVVLCLFYFLDFFWFRIWLSFIQPFNHNTEQIHLIMLECCFHFKPEKCLHAIQMWTLFGIGTFWCVFGKLQRLVIESWSCMQIIWQRKIRLEMAFKTMGFNITDDTIVGCPWYLFKD